MYIYMYIYVYTYIYTSDTMPFVWIQYLVLVFGEQVVDDGLCPLCRQQWGNLRDVINKHDPQEKEKLFCFR